jgi:tetratricopeptide (TPR) repeat protein
MKEIRAFILLLGLALGNSDSGAAVLPYAMTPAELARLPPYCAVRLQSDSRTPEYQAWRARIGENFGDIHHYCHGLKSVNRYWGARTANERKYYLQEAKGEFDYIANTMKPDFTMGADLYSNRGEVLRLMGKVSEAINDFIKALSIDPKIVKPYLQLADLYEKAKDRTRSLEVTTEGLRHLPESRALQRRYLELGGKPPYPEPIHEAPVEEAQSIAASPTQKVEEPTAVDKAANDKPAYAPVMAPEGPAPASQPKIGTPKNPYCRFCPD